MQMLNTIAFKAYLQCVKLLGAIKSSLPELTFLSLLGNEAFPAPSQGGFGASDAFSFDQTPPQQGFVQQGSNAGQSNNPFF